ncbi:hypothetical protein ACN1C3_30220 [Pseudomonas sp. H11T01]|uniref:hypothetical protein n=1 Tax=Pseudomonas sp. H11T01 TaxID=3402749 RepID=UPI003ACD75BD
MTDRLGAPKTGGRRKGSLDKAERLLLTETMAADILAVYKKLGGVKYLLKVAQERPELFLSQCLSRLLPPPFKDPDVEIQFNNNGPDSWSLIESGRRVAFVLAAAANAQQQLDITPVVERVPVHPEPLLQPEQPTDQAQQWQQLAPEPLPPQEPGGFHYSEADPRPYADQHADWLLTRDTL